METLSPFCTCRDLRCPQHPSRHGEGCSPCVAKNLRQGEIPSCFFNMVPGSENRSGHSFSHFARLVLAAEKKASD